MEILEALMHISSDLSFSVCCSLVVPLKFHLLWNLENLCWNLCTKKLPSHQMEMQSCPKADHCNFKEENFYLITEAYVSRGYLAVGIDSRYHGERASSLTAYQDALVLAWKTGDTMPFIYDTVWDLIKLVDYLTRRDNIDPSWIGITGESLGGMHAWFAAVADTRYSVVVPIIGVQGFRWAIANGKWQAQVNSIKPIFIEAQKELHKNEIDEAVVEKVWDKIAPGLASQFDAPYTIPIIAPRPMLILTGEKDARCPLEGLQIPKLKAEQAYENAGCPEKFKMIAERRIWHRMTPLMVEEASNWLDRYLK